MKASIIIGLFAFVLVAPNSVFSQFSGPAGQAGSDAIHCESELFVHWAFEATVSRGFVQVGEPDLGYANFGEDAAAIGKADNNVVSLGDGGSALLQFPFPIVNGPGPDFAVFENAFDDQFLELAHVEVSSNGIDFYRFPGISLTQWASQIESFGILDATKIHLLAGKYVTFYGLPFDLDSLPNHQFLDKNNILFVRVVDVIGSIQAGTGSTDRYDNLINDPWPTPFPSSGFDLDAVGVINDKSQLQLTEAMTNFVQLWPNPVDDLLTVNRNDWLENARFKIVNLTGKVLISGVISSGQQTIDVSDIDQGLYFLKLESKGKFAVRKFMKQ